MNEYDVYIHEHSENGEEIKPYLHVTLKEDDMATWIAEQQANMLIKDLQHENLEIREEARETLVASHYEGIFPLKLKHETCLSLKGNAGTEAFTFPDLLGNVAFTLWKVCHLETPNICNITINERKVVKEVYSYKGHK